MRKNVERAIEEYNKKHNRAKFGYYEIRELFRLSKKGEGAPDSCDIMFNSLKFGYIVGYEAAKRELKKSEAAADHIAQA